MPKKKQDINVFEVIEILCKKVYNKLGYGLNETIYEKALVEELRDCGLFKNVEYEYVIPLNYTTEKKRTIQISTLRLDILIDNSILLELKSVDTPIDKVKEIKTNKYYQQAFRYSKITGIKNLILVNFGKKVEFVKLI